LIREFDSHHPLQISLARLAGKPYETVCEKLPMNAMRNAVRWSVCMASFCALWCSTAAVTQRDEIQESVQALLKRAGGKVEMDKLLAQVMKYGSAAVPILIEAYPGATPAQRGCLAICLCQMPTVESLDFLKETLRKHEDDRVATAIVQHFPVEQEDQITLLLVDLLGVPRIGFWASERLRHMVLRKPSRAGALIRAMEASDATGVGKNWKIGSEVLAFVSGYAFSWDVQLPPASDRGAAQREFWIQWWKRSEDKEPLEWLVDTYHSNSKALSRQAQAVQQMAALKDPRAKDFFLQALDSQVEEVRYWGVIGLKKLDRPDDPQGYGWETFRQEQAQVVEQLKQKFAAQK
jgi:hypothetical protein